MKRVTFRIPGPLLEEVEAKVEDGEYPNRSEALRGTIRDGLRIDRGASHRPDPPWRR